MQQPEGVGFELRWSKYILNYTFIACPDQDSITYFCGPV